MVLFLGIDKGLLGAQMVNCVGYIGTVNNLGIVPQRGHRLVNHSYWKQHPVVKKLYDKVYCVLVRMAFYILHCPFCHEKLLPSSNDIHYMSFIYIRGKTIQGVLFGIILVIIMVLDGVVEANFACFIFEQNICTTLEFRQDLNSKENYYIGIVMLSISMFCFIMYLLIFRLYLHRYLRLGFVLSRDPWVLIRNGKWSDGFRALRSAGGTQTRLDMISIFRKVIDDRIDLPAIPYRYHRYALDLPVKQPVAGHGSTVVPAGYVRDEHMQQMQIIPVPNTSQPPSLAWNRNSVKSEELTDETKKEAAVIISEVNRYWKLTKVGKQGSVDVSHGKGVDSDKKEPTVEHGGDDDSNDLELVADDLDNDHFMFDLLFYALENDHTSFVQFFLNSFVFRRINKYSPLHWRFQQYSNLLYFVMQENVSIRNEMLKQLILYLNPLAKRRLICTIFGRGDNDEFNRNRKYPLTLLINPSYEATLEFCLQIPSLFNYIIDMSLVKFCLCASVSFFRIAYFRGVFVYTRITIRCKNALTMGFLTFYPS